jgi:hypothetical protein
MSKQSNPVEKIIETLFFHLVYQANPARPFVYASLDGNSEKRFGDALAYVGTVFVFEFKRSLNNVKDELKKFKKILAKNEKEFDGGLNKFTEYLKTSRGIKFKEYVDLLLIPPAGHNFVALASIKSTATQSENVINSAADSSILDIRPYLKRLRNNLCESITSDERYCTLGLVENYGMPLTQAIKYFKLISLLKAPDDSDGELGDTDSDFACFAIDQRGVVGIASCSGIQDLQRLFEHLQDLNRLALRHSEIDRGNTPSKESYDRSQGGPSR